MVLRPSVSVCLSCSNRAALPAAAYSFRNRASACPRNADAPRLWKINRHKRAAATPLLRPLLVTFVGEEVFERGEHERPETALGLVHRRQVILVQKPGEKLLGQILGIVRAFPQTPDVGVKGRPINTAQPLQGVGGFDGALLIHRRE